MVRLTAALVAASLASLGTAILQWRSSENQGVDTHNLAAAAGKQSDAASTMADAAGDQVDAANNFADSAEEINRKISDAVGAFQRMARSSEDSVRQAKNSFDYAVEQARLDQRAWVGDTGVNWNKFSETETPTATADIVNSGKTPALGVSMEMAVRMLPANVPFEPSYDEPLGVGSKVAIQPQQKVTISNPPDSKFLFTKERMEVIRNGTFRLYVYGRVEYRDVFN